MSKNDYIFSINILEYINEIKAVNLAEDNSSEKNIEDWSKEILLPEHKMEYAGRYENILVECVDCLNYMFRTMATEKRLQDSCNCASLASVVSKIILYYKGIIISEARKNGDFVSY